MTTSVLKIYKETALPGSLTPNSIYLVAPTAHPNYLEIYVTGTSASVVKRTLNVDDVQALIDDATAGLSGGELNVVADIAARDALNPTTNMIVLVKDATGDSTVDNGAALYVYELATTTWSKIGEYESLDVVLNWSDINGKPTSSVANIDDAVNKRHTHANKTQLDKIDEDVNGNFKYNGNYPQAGLETESW